MEDRTARDDQARTGSAHVTHVVEVYPAVDLHVCAVREYRPEPFDAVESFGHELLPGVAGVNAHAEHDVGAAGDRRHVLRVRLGIEGDADTEPVLARGGDRRRDILDDLVVKRNAVATGTRDLREVAPRVIDHEVAIELGAYDPMDERRDREQHDRSDRDRLDEVTVADVEVEDAGTGVEQPLDLLA